jgi:hypothetical protein
MDSSRRTSRKLRRVAMMAALAALLVPAGPAEAKKKKVAKPVVSRVTPSNAAIGDTITIYGRNFIAGKGRNSVAFKRDGSPAIFVKSDVSTRRQIKVVLPAKLSKYLVLSNGAPGPTPFRLRVLAKRFGKAFTPLAKSPVIGPERPADEHREPPKAAADGDCDGDGTLNGADADDDNDLLADGLENTLKTDQCNRDSDVDGVEDGYEYRSAIDLNDDEFQDPNTSLPFPAKRPYPNPLDAGDANADFDGDSLSLTEEFKLWIFTIQSKGAARTLDGLTYSDGLQHSVYSRGADNRRKPALAAGGYDRQQEFLAWASGNGYDPVAVSDTDQYWYQPRPTYDIRDVNRSGAASTGPDLGQQRAEVTYYDLDQDGWLDDRERDEDADGLTNFDEAHGCMMDAAYWKNVYSKETPYGVTYGGSSLDDADSDGDGVRDGADDADHDDVPNLWECSRQMASGRAFDSMVDPPDPPDPTPLKGFVNPFNPCLPSELSRTCNRTPSLATAWAPYNGSDKYYYVWN